MRKRFPCIVLVFILCFPVFCTDSAKLAVSAAAEDHFAEICDRSDWHGRLAMYFLHLAVPGDSKDKSGDATILIAPSKEVMLLDCGHPDAADDVIGMLHALGIEKIAVFVNSHPHIDHLGAFPAIADAFPVGRVYRTKVAYPSSPYYSAFEEACRVHAIPVFYLGEGDSFSFGTEVRADVLSPPKKIVYPAGYPDTPQRTQFLNDESLAVQFVYGSSRALFCGDLYRAGERRLIAAYGDRLKSDVAKANHHGNDTSNSAAWVQTVSPAVVVAMNDGMGSMDVYRRYRKKGTVYYHTFFNGTVRVLLGPAHQLAVQPRFSSWVEQK